MRGKRILNVLYIMAVVTGLLAVSVYTLLIRKPVESSASENRTLATLADLGGASFSGGTLQDGLENVLSDQFPEREKIVRLKKRTERKLTQAASPDVPLTVLFKVPDIDIYELGSSDWMINPVREYTEEKTDRYTKRAEQINALQLRHPQASIYVYYPTQVNETSLFDQDNHITAAGPAMIQLLKDNLKVPFQSLSIPDIATYQKYFLRSDHHPSYEGSRKIYEDIMTMMGKAEDIRTPVSTVCAGDFYGTFASRTGYISRPDNFCMYDYELPDFDVYDESGTNNNDIYISRHDFATMDFSQQTDEYPYYYGICYAASQPIMEYDTKRDDLDNCLIVGDSYSMSVSDLLASEFNKTWLLFPYLYTQEHHTEFDYDHFIEDNHITTVIYMLTGENYYYKDEYEDRFQETLIEPNGGNY